MIRKIRSVRDYLPDGDQVSIAVSLLAITAGLSTLNGIIQSRAGQLSDLEGLISECERDITRAELRAEEIDQVASTAP